MPAKWQPFCLCLIVSNTTGDITKTKQSTTKPCAYFKVCTVWRIRCEIGFSDGRGLAARCHANQACCTFHLPFDLEDFPFDLEDLDAMALSACSWSHLSRVYKSLMNCRGYRKTWMLADNMRWNYNNVISTAGSIIPHSQTTVIML